MYSHPHQGRRRHGRRRHGKPQTNCLICSLTPGSAGYYDAKKPDWCSLEDADKRAIHAQLMRAGRGYKYKDDSKPRRTAA